MNVLTSQDLAVYYGSQGLVSQNIHESLTLNVNLVGVEGVTFYTLYAECLLHIQLIDLTSHSHLVDFTISIVN